jgi:serine protease Do
MLVVATGIAAAQQPEPAPPPPPPPKVVGERNITVMPRMGGSFLGVGVKEIDSERARELKLREEFGVEITNVEEEGPAAKAGVKVGDVVQEYNGQRVEGTEQFVRFVRETPAGRQVNLGIFRGGANQTLIATIGKRKPMSAQDWDKFRKDMEHLGRGIHVEMPDVPNVSMSWRTGMLGVVVEGIDSQLAEYFGVKKGVLIRSVGKDTPAAKAGLKAGDVIVKIDTETVETHRALTSAIRTARAKGTFPVTVMRDKRETTVNVTMEPERESSRSPRGRMVSEPQEF